MHKGDLATLMRSKRFLPLFLCQFLGAFGDNLVRTAFAALLAFKAMELSDGLRSIVITMSMGLFMLPFILLSATGGKVADKFNKAKLIRWIKFTSIFIGLMSIVGFYANSYTLILISIFLLGVATTFFGPVKYSILPDHLEKDELLVANGAIEAGTFMAILLGIITGGVLVSTESNSMHPVCITILATCILGYVTSLFIPDTEIASEKANIRLNIFSETKRCLDYSKEDRDLFLSIMGISWFWLIGGVFMSQMPNFTKDALGGDKSVYILLLSIFSVGTGIGSIFCNKLLKGRIETRYVPISILFMTFSVFALWYTSIFFDEKATALGGIHYFLSSLKGILVCFEIFFIAFFGGIYIVPLYAFMQVRAKKTHRSRIIAANNIYNAIFMVCASIVAILLLAIKLSVSNLILLLAITNFLTAVYICKILPDTVIKNIMQTIFSLLHRVEVVGMENYYKAGERVLIVANHASFIDPPLIAAFLPKNLVFAIDYNIARSWWIRPFLSYLRAFPIDPTNPMATKTLIEQLKQDKHVVIFPEGRITVTGSLMKIYEGPGMIADKAGAKLLPIRIDGPQYSPFSRLHGKVKMKLFPKVKITIMEPQTFDVPKEIIGRERRHLIGNMLYDIMSKMMFEGSENKLTLFASLIEATEQHGPKHVVVEDVDRNSLSYKRILTGSFLLGFKIQQKTELNERVGILLPNAAGSVVTFFACLAYGRTPAMLNFSTGSKNMIASCKASTIRTVYTSRRFINKADFYHIVSALEEAGIQVIYLEDVRAKFTIIDKLWALMAATFPRHFYKICNKNIMPKSDDPAVILYTSGSEGTPKGVVLSHANIQANIKQAASRVDFTSSDKVFNALPIFHSFGLTGGFLLPVLSGVKTFFYPSPLHYRIIPEMVYGSNCTIMFGTDTFLTGYAKFAHPYDFYSIRYIFAGAEKLRDETRKVYMEKFGIRIFEGYGATEAAPIISVNTPMHYKAGTVGRIMPNMKYHLEKVPGIEEGGKLIVSGPNIMIGYLKTDKPGVIQKPEYEIDGKLKKGWYDTGDIVSVDKHNYVTILGRYKRFAKIGGEMISLAAVEEITQSLWPEKMHGVVNIPHDKKGETLIMFTTEENASREDLMKHIKRSGMTELFCPKVFHYMKELPLLGAGKIDFMKLKELALELAKKDKDLNKEDDE
jgi:acyl-[acyl-carrier-protein]-phospholipid O-acyltransferase/long-chain-fatty-acid--[acyl-carrier-protein] ligase